MFALALPITACGNDSGGRDSGMTAGIDPDTGRGNEDGSADGGDSPDGGDAKGEDDTVGDPGDTTAALDTSDGAEAATDPGPSDSGDDKTDGDGGMCPGRGVALDFSYIWIANSTQGTVSKIDTVTAVEVGRYYVDAYAGASISNCQGPSRTSVNLQGDVVVLDRGGGLAKFYADTDDCPDGDGSGVIETATDSNPLPWGQDECLAWQIDVPHAAGSCDGPRAVQWTAPPVHEDCTSDDPEVWIAFCNANNSDVTVWRLAGADGSLVVEVPIAAYNCATYGPYGGVVDADNDFWFVDRNAGQRLFHVAHDCVPVNPGDCVEAFNKPAGEDAYGITIDGDGQIWIAGVGNSLYAFDPATSTWTSHRAALANYFATSAPIDSNVANTLRGLMVDAQGILWVASIQQGAWNGGSNPGLLRVDPSVDPPVFDWFGPATLTGIQHAAGISIDVDGYVWLVDTLGNQAFKIDPNDPSQHTVVGGLQYPYTYSDMTGYALAQIVPQ